MAEEKSNDSTKETPKESKPWLALFLMLLIVPLVTLAITEFVVIPRLQSSMSGQTKEDAKTTGNAGAKSAEVAMSSYRFDEVVANLSGTMGTRFIKVSFEVQGKSEDLGDAMRKKKSIVSDAVISTLASESIQSLEVPGGRNRLRLSLIRSINEALSNNLIEELYFTEFIIQ
jgi:flagellar FliL protein